MKSSLPTEGFVKLGVVLEHIPVGKTQWYEGIADGIFPKPYRVLHTSRMVCWHVDDIRQVIEEILEGGAINSQACKT